MATMTKKDIILTIQKQEAHAWMEYNRHNYITAPEGLSYFEECERQKNDPESCRLRHAWYALHNLLKTIGVNPDNECPEAQRGFDYANKIYQQCKPYNRESA